MPRPWNKGLRRQLRERLFEKVELRDRDECWEFRAAWRSRYGYGRLRAPGWNGRPLQAHVAMYELMVGPVPAGHWLRHDCDNPLCCNPAHLRPGTAADNRRDQFEHGVYSALRRAPRDPGREATR
jgi:hypothetical protein